MAEDRNGKLSPENKASLQPKARAVGKKSKKELELDRLREDIRIVLQMKADQLVDDILCEDVRPGTKIRLRLFKYERDLLVNYGVTSMGLTEKQIADLKAAKQPELRMTLSEFDDLAGYVAAEANHCDNERVRARLDNLSESIDLILRRHRETQPRKPGTRRRKPVLLKLNPDDEGPEPAP